MKIAVALAMIAIEIMLSSCEKRNTVQEVVVATISPEPSVQLKGNVEPEVFFTDEMFIGKSIHREAPGPDDSASFKITILPEGKLEGDTEASMSWATGVLRYETGSWENEGDNIKFALEYVGQVSQPTQDGYIMAEKRQVLRFKVAKIDIIKSDDVYLEFLGDVSYD